MDGIQRGKVPFDDGDKRRVYVDTVDETMGLSVSEINEFRDDPEKKAALENWRDVFDGSAEYAKPHWKEQGLYKRKRGTLAHYVLLSQLDDIDKTDEERDAETTLKEWAERRPATTEDDVPDVDYPHRYDGAQAWSRCMREINWAVNTFEDVAAEYNITPATTIDVEQYVVNESPLYGGQFDLLYDSGETTLCDLKFSSGIRYGNKLQLAAYRNALLDDERFPDEIPRVQIIRLYPDDREVECVTKYADSRNAVGSGVASNAEATKYTDSRNAVGSGVASNAEATKHVDGTVETFSNLANDDDETDWDESIDALTDEFCELAEGANDEWLTQLSIDEALDHISDDTVDSHHNHREDGSDNRLDDTT